MLINLRLAYSMWSFLSVSESMQVNRLFISVLPLKIQILLLIYEEINILMLKYLIKKMDILYDALSLSLSLSII